jgi:hypothetical protein
LRPEGALETIVAQLRDEQSVISPHVVDPAVAPALGLLTAAGPRAARAPGEYAVVVEAVREGYLLHYGKPRLLSGADRDLALLAGDHLYARGLERLAALADLEAVRELADLISLCAQMHADGGAGAYSAQVWLGTATALGAGASEAHEEAKRRLRAGRGDAAAAMWAATTATAAAAGLGTALERAAEAIGFSG